jgi:ABC-2 type transport system permease protein
MRAIGWCLPPSHVFEGLRALLAGGRMPVAELGLAVALTAVHLLLAGWALRRVFAHARRTGLLARYSAEGVG